jgi:ribosomal protein S3
LSSTQFVVNIGHQILTKQVMISSLIENSLEGVPFKSDKSEHETITKYSSENDAVALKVLVCQNVAGSLIGRNGNSIQNLQLQSGARIRLSQASDFFPGTQGLYSLAIVVSVCTHLIS